jgi:iron complex transport system substrate-binding protein
MKEQKLLTRRGFLVGTGGMLGAAALSACAAPAQNAPSQTAGQATAAPVAAPTSALAIVALDEFAGLAALSLGAKPANVFLAFGFSTAKAIFDSAGVPTTAAGADGVNLEAVAALKPSNIIGVSLPTTAAVVDKLKQIATTTVIEYSASWQEQLNVLGAALGRSDAAAKITSQLDSALNALKKSLANAGKAGQTVSVIGAVSNSMFGLAKTGLVGSMLQQAGLNRPAAQAVDREPTDPFVPVNAEKLADHDADTILVLSGGEYSTAALTSLALWPKLSAAKNDRVINVLAEIWFGSNAFTADWIIRDLRAALLGVGSVAGEGDVLRRWGEFTAGA